jgi:hypothetical protein
MQAQKMKQSRRDFTAFCLNDRVTEKSLIEELSIRCSHNVANRDVVSIQDSSSFGLSHHSNSIKKDSGLGLVGNKTGLGFLSHCSLVIDAHTEAMLGYSDVQIWHRTEDKSNNTTGAYKKQPIEEKESYKWIKASEQTKKCLAAARSITIIQDREGDIYEQFCVVPDEKTNLLIRNRDNRKLADGSRLYECLEQSPVLGQHTVAVYGDIRKEKVKRTATVGVKEPDSTKKDTICWRILTTHKIETYEQAIAVIEMYKLRWYIEQLFRLLKKQGYQIESTQLESGWAIRKLFVLVLNTALRWMQLYLAYDVEESQSIEEVFDELEVKCLRSIQENYIKKTDQTNNPYSPKRLSWASWIIVRLGGWKGNKKQRKAGPIIIKRGLEKFQIMYEGWKLANDYT